MRRFVLIALVAAGLSPGLYWREAPLPPDFRQIVAIEPLLPPGGPPLAVDSKGFLRLTGAWALTSRNGDFGSYSALLALDDGALTGFSDRGAYLRLPAPLIDGDRAKMGGLFRDKGAPKNLQDIESATSDRATGRIWLGLEGRNAVIRMEPGLLVESVAQPAAMRGWSANRGPEAMVRLRDGRFIVLAEAESAWGATGGPALLFAGDPVERAAHIGFRFEPGGGFSPTDMAELPDGRVLILLRRVRLGLPYDFSARLVLADPAAIREGEAWPWQDIALLDPALPMDNYEGLAVAGGAGGGPLTLWLISDDNGASLIQRTLLIRLEWDYPALK